MKRLFLSLVFLVATGTLTGFAQEHSSNSGTDDAVTVSRGSLTVPTYEHVGRYMEPPLFSDSTLTGLYPFTTYIRGFKDGDPQPQKYPAIFVENKYLKLTYIPELGGRFFALYDKIHHREVFYRNDVIKPTQFSPRFNWPQSGIELTGPYDAHTLTLHNEPFWSHTILKNKDGSVSVLLGEVDPIYHMNVTFTATIYPEIDALEISTFCYNGNDGQKPQMLWSNAAFPVTSKLRFLYPMTLTVGHTTGVVSPWPNYEGVDLSWAHNNMHMLGVFGIDSYDNYGGAYELGQDYGVFRYADRRVVQGMKMWTFGFGSGSTEIEHSYTDHAGPYFEAQSGRMVWDGHYEWVYPHTAEQWHEWWIPVAGTGGLTTLTRDAALHLVVHDDPSGKDSSLQVALSPVRPIRNVALLVTAKVGILLQARVDLVPGVPVLKSVSGIKADNAGLSGIEVRLTSPEGKVLLDYHRPAADPGGNVTPFAKGLLTPPVAPEKMTAEELVLAARFKQKDLDSVDAEKLAGMALKIDPGYSAAHQLLGMLAFDDSHFDRAAAEFQKAVDRDPYDSQSWYYLSVCEIQLGQQARAEGNLYYIWPGSAYYGAREYQLGRLAFLRGDSAAATEHLLGAVNSDDQDLDARLLLAVVYRDQANKPAAMEQLKKVSETDPADRVARAEEYLLSGDSGAEEDLRTLMGGQSEEAIQVSLFYSSLQRWKDAAQILRMVEPPHNQDPWGIPPVYYYTLAYNLKQAGDASAAAEYRRKARAAAGTVERFPYRVETIAPLEDAVKEDPQDTVARFDLGCDLYFQGRHSEAMSQWEAINHIDPHNYEARRSLGLAYEAEGQLTEAVPQLREAAAIQPASMLTVDDLADLYARTGNFQEQLALLKQALQRSPGDDHLEESILKADLIRGDFDAAQGIVEHHTFKPAHRTYSLRDEYRELQYGRGADAWRQGHYAEALQLFRNALKPPPSLGMDDFESQAAPRIEYYIGRTLEALGRSDEAKKAYEESAHTATELTGGGSDSWSPENFFVVFALERLGRHEEAASLVKQFQIVADSRMESGEQMYSARAHYLAGLIALYQGHPKEAEEQMKKSVQIEPDYIEPRLELNGHAIAPVG